MPGYLMPEQKPEKPRESLVRENGEQAPDEQSVRAAEHPGRPVRLSFRPLPLNVTLLLAMLAVVLVSVGGNFAFSSLALQREFRKLPADIQTYLHARDEALRHGKTPPDLPTPPRNQEGNQASIQSVNSDLQTSTGSTSRQASQTPTQASTPDNSSANTSNAEHPRTPWPVRQVDWLRGLQRQLLQIGLVALALSALLALWLARRIAFPVGVVSQAAERLAAGEAGVRVPVFRAERELAGLAQSFNAMAQTLEKVELERKQAVTDIAHELRTPLAVMQARLDALEDGIYPMTTDQIALLSDQTQLLTRLVGDLRTLTLLDAGQLTLNRQALNLAQVTRDVTDNLQAQALSRQIRLELGEMLDAPVWADPDRLRQVLTNLIENALRHARQRVVVGLSHEDGVARLTVDDDGLGIPADKRLQVFTRFTRLDESRNRDAGGSGLGLSVVQALVTAHGGRAKAEASALGGARLYFTLPLAMYPPETQALPAAPLKALNELSPCRVESAS